MNITKGHAKKMVICALAGFSSGMPLYFFLNLLPTWLRSDLVFVNFFDWFYHFRPNLLLVQNDLLRTYSQFFSQSPYLIRPPC